MSVLELIRQSLIGLIRRKIGERLLDSNSIVRLNCPLQLKLMTLPLGITSQVVIVSVCPHGFSSRSLIKRVAAFDCQQNRN